MEKEKYLLLYDGTCALCHWAVTFSLKRDKQRILYYVPQESELGQRLIQSLGLEAVPDSIILMDQRGVWRIKSAAVQCILKRIGGFWKSLAFFSQIFPQGFLDFFYDLIAHFRYKVFGRKEVACPLLPEGTAQQFEALRIEREFLAKHPLA